MTSTNQMSYTAADALKYVTAEGKSLLEYAADRLGWMTVEHPEVEEDLEHMQEVLEQIRRMLIQETSVFCRDGNDFNTYSDGRQIKTAIEIEYGNILEYRWHPQHGHRSNRPRTVLDRHQCTSGTRRSVIVAAPGVLDTIDHGRGLHLVDSEDDAR